MLSMELQEGGQPYPTDTQRTCVVVPAERLEVLMYLEFRITRNNALWPFCMWEKRMENNLVDTTGEESRDYKMRTLLRSRHVRSRPW